MNSSLRRVSVLCALLMLGGLNAIQAQANFTIKQIEVSHVGPPAVSDALIRANIRVKVGETVNPNSIEDDVKNLMGTGYFHDVRVVRDVKDNGLALTYVVQGKPVLTDVRFSGNKKFSTAKLLKKITSKTGEPLDAHKIFTDSQEILKAYQKSGLQQTEVKPIPVINDNLGRGTVTFEIKEAPKVKIRNVVFEGASAFKQKKLRSAVKTRRHWMFSWLTGSGKLKDEVFEDDKEKLAEFYREAGYIDFDLKEVKFDYLTPKELVVRFNISEGNQYKVGAIEFKGNTLFSTQELNRRLTMNVGQTFTPKGLNRNTDAVEETYETKGYLTVNHEGKTQISAIKNANVEKGTMDLVYEIEEGNQNFIEKIEIRGNTKTKDRVIRRELAVAPGEIFNMYRVDVSTNRLHGLNYFEKINSQVEPTDVSDRKNLVISVQERNTGNFQIGAGFSSIDAVVGFAEVSQGNFDLFNPPHFTGGGQKFRLRTQVGTRRQDYLASFVEPWFLGQRLALGVDVYHREINYLSDIYEQTQTGARLSLTKALPYNFEVGVSYTIENIGIHFDDSVKNPTIIVTEGPGRGSTTTIRPGSASEELLLEEGKRLVSKVGASIAHDTRNSALLPNRGQRTELSGQLAGGPFGGDSDFYKLEARTSWYFKGFFEGHILETIGRTGVVKEYGDSDRVPLFDRYFLGGLDTLRGYRYRRVSPKDINGEPVGGDTYWLGSAEYSIPIIERLRFALFYDIGNVYPKAYSFTPQHAKDPFYSDNWGVGIRLNIPNLGPLRLDYAIPISHDDQNKGSGRFQFGVGFTRDY